MFASLLGKCGKGGDKEPTASEGGYGNGSDGGSGGNVGLPTHSETLLAVISTQQKRCQGCQLDAEEAEKQRDLLLEEGESEAAAVQEEIRKAKTSLCIVLQTQIDVLQRVLQESSGSQSHAHSPPVSQKPPISISETISLSASASQPRTGRRKTGEDAATGDGRSASMEELEGGYERRDGETVDDLLCESMDESFGMLVESVDINKAASSSNTKSGGKIIRAF